MNLKELVPAILAFAITTAFFACIALLIFHGVPEQSRAIIDGLLGILGTMTVSITQYYFGSSAGSAAKTETISSLVKKE